MKNLIKQKHRDPVFISRTEIIKDIGKTAYDNAVKKGELKPIKFGNKRNSKIRVPYEQYRIFINNLINS